MPAAYPEQKSVRNACFCAATAIHIEHPGFLSVGRILTNDAGSPISRDSRGTTAIKVEKIYFLKTKLASLAWKLFLHRINSVKALRHQKATNGSGCRISRFKRNIRARITHLSLFQSATLFRHFRNENVLLPPGCFSGHNPQSSSENDATMHCTGQHRES